MSRIIGTAPAIALAFGISTWFTPAAAVTPDAGKSHFEPEAGPPSAPLTGLAAVPYFRACPNNDGGSSLPNNARIKIVLLGSDGVTPVPDWPADKVYVSFNGGTPVQGFSGSGADSIIVNSVYNQSPHCPLVVKLFADAKTNSAGETYITLGGASSTPGVGQRDPKRKWGHYDEDIPVYVDIAGAPTRIFSRLQYRNAPYKLRIKSFDLTGGLGTALNVGEAVTSADFNAIRTNLYSAVPSPLDYWRDFDDDGFIALPDLNMIAKHVSHDCDTPHNDPGSDDWFGILASGAGSGAMIPAGIAIVPYGSNQSFTMTPDPGYCRSVRVDGVLLPEPVPSYTFFSVTMNHTISALFEGPTITSGAGPHGSIVPSGATFVSCGTDQTYTVSPDSGYHIEDVLVDGVSVGAVGTYTFPSVTGNHTIVASFAP